jgi:hypothetical protein
MFQPWSKLLGEKPQPQFFLRDAMGKEYGVVEHYSDRSTLPEVWMGLEFYSVDFASARPFVVFDLTTWKVVTGKSRNLPEPIFEDGLAAFLDRWPETEREKRRERAKRGFKHAQVTLAEQGYTIAYHELFAEELHADGLTVEGLPKMNLGSTVCRVDDQYGIRPGEYRNEVTLVLLPDKVLAPGEESKPLALVNWRFGEGFEVINAEVDEELVAGEVEKFMAENHRESEFRERLQRMRREGVLLGVKPDLSVKPVSKGKP